jgi:hypothetical protein
MPGELDLTDYAHFAACWNDGRFFDAHEALEPRWIANRDPALRGLIQLAAALHHLQRRNLKGARIVLGRALAMLTGGAPPSCPFDVAELTGYARRVLEQMPLQDANVLLEGRPRLGTSVGPG